jgi:1-aminocyclopropane-1-carboxylate deaminase/D-cysteine desulfhydrase-like pyridoxal-dependent ACC family enzyme
MRLEQHIGLGYAQSTAEELEYITQVSRQTGVVLDPVYSGKAARGMAQDLIKRADASGDGKGQRPPRVLFIHTGGLLGLYEKAEQLAPLLQGGWQEFSRAAQQPPAAL